MSFIIAMASFSEMTGAGKNLACGVTCSLEHTNTNSVGMVSSAWVISNSPVVSLKSMLLIWNVPERTRLREPHTGQARLLHLGMIFLYSLARNCQNLFPQRVVFSNSEQNNAH